MKTRIALSLVTAVVAISGFTAVPAFAQPNEAVPGTGQFRDPHRPGAGRFEGFGPAYRGDGRGANDWEIDSRLRAAAQRIDRGRGNGITKKEGKRLHDELNSIERRVAQLRADGRLGRRDRDEIDRRLDQLARNTRSQQFD